jgi:bacteriophage HK97-gp10 putative tail-component
MLRFTMDLGPLSRALRELDQNLDSAMAAALHDTASMVANEARSNHAYTDRTGKLSRSIHAQPVDGTFTGRNLTVDVVADTPYARFVEDGTTAHMIVPRKAKALRWYARNGRAVFARKVQHPGTKPVYYLKGALERVFPQAIERSDQALRVAFARSGFEVA